MGARTCFGHGPRSCFEVAIASKRLVVRLLQSRSLGTRSTLHRNVNIVLSENFDDAHVGVRLFERSSA